MSNTETDAIANRIEELAAGVCDELGAEVYDVEVRRHGRAGTVRILVDKAGASEPGHGITVGEVTRVAKEVGYLLDAEDVVPFGYTFEVSSPGVERTLNTPRQVQRNIGQPVRLVLTEETDDGLRVIEGTLEAFESNALRVRTDAGDLREIPFENVRRGRTVFDFSSAKSKKK